MASILKVENISHTNGSAAMTIDDSGRVLQPAKPAILCMGNNSSGVVVGGNTLLPPANYETTTNGFAQGGMTYNNTNGEITVPVAGLYFVSGQIYNNTGATHGRIIMRVNGDNAALAHMNAGENCTVSTHIIKNLSAGDVITFVNGYSTTLFFGNLHTFLQAYLIG